MRPDDAADTAGARQQAVADLESMAVLGRIRAWAPGHTSPAPTTAPAPANAAVTIASPDGLVTLDLNLSEEDLKTPAVQEWLRLLKPPDRGGGRP